MVAVPRARSWLFVPGAAERFVAKLPEAGPDVAVLDLEDGLASGDLPAARERMGRLLARPATPSGPLLAVRSHEVVSAEFPADIAVLGEALGVLVLPKVDAASDVVEAASSLAAAGLPHVALVVMIESARGLERLPEILSAHASVKGVAFGAEDFAADLGLPPAVAEPVTPGDGWGGPSPGRTAIIDHARARIVVTATAGGLPWMVDTPTLKLGDPALVEADSRRSRSMGFSGRFVVHPEQVAPTHRGFTPSEAEASWARTVLAASANKGGATRSGVGHMVDEAVLRQARRILATLEN